MEIPRNLLQQIHLIGEAAYPEEGAGFLLGSGDAVQRIDAILPLPNSREDGARHNRYLISPEDYLNAELEADRRGLTILGVFHSHPDHPNVPSEFDRDWAQPFFAYIITSVNSGKAVESRCWKLMEDRSAFAEEPVTLMKDN